jgi:hypothetical protein
VVSFLQVTSLKPRVHLSSPHTRYMHHPSYYSRFYHPNDIWGAIEIIRLLIM